MARRLLALPLRMARNARKLGRGRRVRDSRGFTLIELMIVVTIVGVLAVLAVVGYRKLVLSSKLTEASNVIGGIRIAQEAYKTERGLYADIGSTQHCPGTGLVVPQIKTQWQPTCNGGTNIWNLLPVHVDGPVQFGYVTFAGPGGGTAATGYGFVGIGGLVVTQPWYIVHAQADLDGTGAAAPFTELVATSNGNQIFQRNEGL